MSAVREALPLPLRAMTRADLASVAQIEAVSYAYPWSETIFRDCLRVGYRCRVLELRGAVAGYAVMSVGAGEAHLLNLCIREDLRGTGLGRGLLEHMLAIARAAGAGKLFLEVRPSNRKARALYRRAGFSGIGVRRHYYPAPGGREDALVLALPLDGSR